MTTALVTHGDSTAVVSPACAFLGRNQRTVRLAFVQARRFDGDLKSATRRCRFGFMQ
jgi:hypothetical protein